MPQIALQAVPLILFLMVEEEGAAEAMDAAVVAVDTIHIPEGGGVEDMDKGAVAGAVLLLHHQHPPPGHQKIVTIPMRNGMPLNGNNATEYKI